MSKINLFNKQFALFNKIIPYRPYAIQVVDYKKYIYTIHFKVINRCFQIICGGNYNKICNFDPFLGWNEWIKAGIKSLSELNCKQK